MALPGFFYAGPLAVLPLQTPTYSQARTTHVVLAFPGEFHLWGHGQGRCDTGEGDAASLQRLWRLFFVPFLGGVEGQFFDVFADVLHHVGAQLPALSLLLATPGDLQHLGLLRL